jgi:hypothetical protein
VRFFLADAFRSWARAGLFLFPGMDFHLTDPGQVIRNSARPPQRPGACGFRGSLTNSPLRTRSRAGLLAWEPAIRGPCFPCVPFDGYLYTSVRFCSVNRKAVLHLALRICQRTVCAGIPRLGKIA